MKNLILLSTTILISVNLFSQSGNTEQNKEPEIVINQSMIEKFNNYEYSTEQVSFYEVFRNYNFDDVKLIMNGYQNSELELSSEKEINGYLSEARQEVEDDNYPQISENRKTEVKENSL